MFARGITRRLATIAILCAFGLGGAIVSLGGQTPPKPPRDAGAEAGDEAVRQRLNQWTVFLGGGSRDSTWMQFASELGEVLDDGDDMRVVPLVSRGAGGNVQDLLYLRSVDAAFTQLDVLEHFRTARRVPGIDTRIEYVVRLPVAELHVTARDNVATLQDLRGRRVVFGGPETASALTGPIVFERLGIAVEPLFVDHAAGLRMLIDGEVDGVVGSMSKPAGLWLKIPPRSGLHLLEVPFTEALGPLYVSGTFSAADYPDLVSKGRRIETVAVPSVLAVSNAPRTSDRFRRLERFVQYLFDRWDRLTGPAFHPRWRDVNLAATVPGWTRFAPAEDLLRRDPAPSDARGDAAAPASEFESWLKREGRGASGNRGEHDALFREFLNRREQQRRP